MTAQVIQLVSATEQVDETIRRTVKALMKGNGINVETLAPAIGMKNATLYRRLARNGTGREFKAHEVAALAVHFGLAVEDLYAGLAGQFVPPQPPDDGASLPRLDSNQQPSGYPSPQVRSLFTDDYAAAA